MLKFLLKKSHSVAVWPYRKTKFLLWYPSLSSFNFFRIYHHYKNFNLYFCMYFTGLWRPGFVRLRRNHPSRCGLQQGRQDQQERADDDPFGHRKTQPGRGHICIKVTPKKNQSVLTKKCCQELTEDTHTVFEMLEFRKIMISCCSRMFQDTNLSRCKDLSVELSLLHIKSIIFFLIKSSSCTEFLFLYVDIRSIVAFYEASQRRISFYLHQTRCFPKIFLSQ